MCHDLNNQFETLPSECQIKLLRIFNSHFTGSCLWNFSSEIVRKLFNSWNVNLRIVLDLPVNAHNYIVEDLSGGKNAKKLIFSRYINFVNSLEKSKRPAVVALLKLAKTDVRSVVGSNLRSILLETDKLVIPGVTKSNVLQDYTVYNVPESEKWRIPLLTSLIEMREERWCVKFDEEDDDLPVDAIKMMIDRACID